MDNESRLLRALAADAAPKRDPGFTLAVIRAAEVGRYREETIRSVLRGAGFATAAASLAVPFLGWAGQNAGAVLSGLFGAACLIVLVGGARLMAARATAVLRH